jgi:gamma-glutamylcyclotransferase (GGCT)/AIG2-like uncharacterized protein YtfP
MTAWWRASCTNCLTRPNEPERSLYVRVMTDVTLDSGQSRPAWAYFYNAPLGRAERIPSGDYLEYLRK